MRDCILTDDDVLFTSRRIRHLIRDNWYAKWHLDMCINQGLKGSFSSPSGRVLVSFGRVQYRSRTNFQTTDYTQLSIINQQRCCSVPFLLSQHSSAGIEITSGPRSYIPIETSNDSDNSHLHLFIDSHRPAHLRRPSPPLFFCQMRLLITIEQWIHRRLVISGKD